MHFLGNDFQEKGKLICFSYLSINKMTSLFKGTNRFARPLVRVTVVLLITLNFANVSEFFSEVWQNERDTGPPTLAEISAIRDFMSMTRMSPRLEDATPIQAMSTETSELRGPVGRVDGNVGRGLSQSVRELRQLSKNLGGGACEWTAAEAIDPITTPNVDSTFLVGFPGSGKRITWLLMEAFTGNVAGDDWDHSRNGYHVAQMKGGYPHHDSREWLWGKKMDQVVFQIRNPRWAVPSWRTLRYELAYSRYWAQSHVRIPWMYTEEAPTNHWQRFQQYRGWWRETMLWSWFIDFWMEEGLIRYWYNHEVWINPLTNTTWQNGHCKHDLDCKPKVIVSYESLIDPATGPNEMARVANAMQGLEGVHVIEEETWSCLYDAVVQGDLTNKSKASARRYSRWDGPPLEEKTFNSTHLEHLLNEVDYILTKYSMPPWDTDQIAIQLIGYVSGYKSEIYAEWQQVLNKEKNITQEVELPYDPVWEENHKIEENLTMQFLNTSNLAAPVTAPAPEVETVSA